MERASHRNQVAFVVTLIAIALPALAAATSPGTAIASNTVTLKPGASHQVVADAEIPGGSDYVTVTLLQRSNPRDKTLASTRVKPGSLVSNLSRAKLTLQLRRTTATAGIGTLEVAGPRNATQPDVAVYKLRWSVGERSSIRATPVPA